MRSARRFSSLVSLVSFGLLAACAVEGGEGAEAPVENTFSVSAAATKLIVDRVGAEATLAAVATPQLSTMQGTLARITSAKTAGTGQSVSARFYVRDPTNKLRNIELTPSLVKSVGGDTALSGRSVTANGYTSPQTGAFVVTSMQLGPAVAPPAPPVGAKRWVTVPCRFPDLPLGATEGSEYFQALFSDTYPGLGDYWKRASNNALSIDASTVLSWTEMPSSTSYDKYPEEERPGIMTFDCLYNADPLVDYSQFDGVVVAFSHNLSSHLVGGDPFPVPFDGRESLPVAALSPTDFRDHSLAARATGMALNLAFSGTAALAFDSSWDVMSRAGVCTRRDPLLGCLAVLPSAAQAARATWLPASQVYRARTSSSAAQVAVDFVGAAPLPGHYGSVMVPIDNDRYFTIEARDKESAIGYERGVPRTGVVIHKYDGSSAPDDQSAADQEATLREQTTRLRFLDINAPAGSTAATNPNDVGSELQVGGTFTDDASDTRITILARQSYGFDVLIQRRQMLTVTSPGDVGQAATTGILCGMGQTDCAERFKYGTEVILSAIPGPGKVYNAWTGCDRTSGTACIVRMDSPKTVSVTFKQGPRMPPENWCCTPAMTTRMCEQRCGGGIGGRPPRQQP